MKNPNGFGSVVKLSGNRRRPYAVRKTLGFNEKGYPIYLCIGYTCTREEGLLMLAEYNKNPYNVEDINITTEELFERWYSLYKDKLSKSLCGALCSAWKYCSSVYKLSYRTIKPFQMQECVDNCPMSYSTKGAIKNLFRHLDRFAMELEIISHGKSELVNCPPIPETSRKPFTKEELSLLWENSGKPWADTVLIFIYSGMRISELLNMKISDIDLNNLTMTGGTKTTAGKNRVIPIHPKILPFIQARIAVGGEFLISENGRKCTSSKYYGEWNKLMSALGMEHTPHECRHTFRSLMDSAGANKRCIDLIMGHKSRDVGERVYTHKTLEELAQAIRLI